MVVVWAGGGRGGAKMGIAPGAHTSSLTESTARGTPVAQTGCGFSFSMWASSSASLAQPLKYRHSIS